VAPRPSFFASYLPKLILSGETAASAKDLLRSQGQSFGDTRFDRAWAETIDFLSRKKITEAAPLNRKLSPDEIGTATRPRARGFLAQVELLIEDPTTKEVAFHTWGARSPEPMSPNWYLRKAIDEWIASGKAGRGTPKGTPVGGMVSGAVEFVAPSPDEEF
jgi:hypothetical protein